MKDVFFFNHHFIHIMSSKDFILSVIELFRNSPCLWQMSHDEYRNKDERRKAYNDLLLLFKTRDENANVDTVRRKLASMRNCFKKEVAKVRKSAAAGETHIPKLWYYKEMLFLEEENYNQRSPSPEEQAIYLDDMSFDDSAEIKEEYVEVIQSPISSPSSSYGRRSSVTNDMKRAKINSEDIIAKVPKTDSQATPKLKFSAYGEHVAEKLRDLPPLMATYCQKIINDAIFLAETNNLHLTSHISS